MVNLGFIRFSKERTTCGASSWQHSDTTLTEDRISEKLGETDHLPFAPACFPRMCINPLCGHRSISIDSDLGALQPYFLVVMVTAASPFYAWMQLRDKRSRWRFEKTFILQKKLSFWPSAVALPFIPAPCSGVVRSSCLGVWFAALEVNGLPALDSSCDLDDSVVWTSIFRSERTLPCLGSLEVSQWPGELEMQPRKQHTLRFWRYVRILPNDFSLRRFLANFSVCHELLDLFFVISETKAFRQGKVVISKSASFFLIKDALVELHFSSGLTKG